MNDKQDVWNAIREIENQTIDSSYVDIRDSVWKDFDIERKKYLRRLLLSSGLISYDTSQWAFQLTAKGITLNKSDLNNDGILKKSKEEWRRTYTTLIIGALLGGVLGFLSSIGTEVWKLKYLKERKTNTIVLPPIQIVHDTVPVPISPVVLKK